MFTGGAKKWNMTLNKNKTISSVLEGSILVYHVGYGMMKPDPERLKPLRELPLPVAMKTLQHAVGLFACYAKWIPRFSNKILKLKAVKSFPLDAAYLADFKFLKKFIVEASLQAMDEF